MAPPPAHRVAEAADRAEARAAAGKPGTEGGKQPAREGRGRLSSMDLVPEDGHEDVFWAVGELNKRERSQSEILFELNDRLAAKDIDPISKSAFNRRSVKLAAAMNRLNEARYIFKGIAPQLTPEAVDEHTLALGEFIKTLCFELSQEDARSIGPKGAMELARAHLAVIQGQKLSSERRMKLEADFKERASTAIETVVKARGISAEVAADMRREMFGVPHGS